MITLHRNTTVLLNARRFTEDSERPLIASKRENGPRPKNPRHLNWEMVVIWSFVIFSFAALFFCFWAISAKCRGEWPA
jgi:hypothetical protein